ncbi:MAG: ROK family protein [Clostridia bacterium]
MASVVALDVGGTAVKYGIVDESGDISREGSFPTEAEKGGQALMARMLSTIDRLSAGVEALLGVGVSTAGHVSQDHAMVRLATNIPGWTGMQVARNVRQHTGLPCLVENDVNAAAQGERWMGAARECRALVMLTLGTGVGGAAILNGQLMTGAGGAAGEFGHITLYPGGLHCECGQDGCFEKYASAGALTRRTRGELPPAHPAHGDVKALFACARAGDAAAEKVLGAWLDDLALGLASLISCYNPDVLLLGGGVSAQGAYLSDAVRARLEARVLPTFLEGLSVRTAQLGNRAGMLGAAYGLFSRRDHLV